MGDDGEGGWGGWGFAGGVVVEGGGGAISCVHPDLFFFFFFFLDWPVLSGGLVSIPVDLPPGSRMFIRSCCSHVKLSESQSCFGNQLDKKKKKKIKPNCILFALHYLNTSVFSPLVCDIDAIHTSQEVL